MRRALARALVGAALVAPALVAPAHAVAAPTVDRFDGARAFDEAAAQVAFGPRPAGSDASRRLAERLRALLPGGRFEDVVGHPGLRNVIGTLPGRGPALVIAAHYDTKDSPFFVGANDGAAGTAVVVELARSLQAARARARARARASAPRARASAGRRTAHRRHGAASYGSAGASRPGPPTLLPGPAPAPQPPREVRFVLFDGEEDPQDGGSFYDEGLRGSRAYAAAHGTEIGQLVLLDFVGDRDLSLPRESGSDVELWGRLRGAASSVGTLATFPDARTGEVIDDHTPFTRLGIPAIDLIDFDYPYFHTPFDTLDKISAESLDITGETVAELARTLGG